MAIKFTAWGVCRKKILYTSQDEANRKAARYSNKFEHRMEAYRCPICKGFHLRKCK